MKKIIIISLFSLINLISFGQANTYFHDRIDTTIFVVADTIGHGANHYYATNTNPDFNIKQYNNGCAVNIFIKHGNTGSATLTLITKTGTLSSKTIKKSNGQNLSSGDIPDSTGVILTYYNGNFRITAIGVAASSSSWSLLGNSGTTAGTNFLGTTDSQDLVFKSNNLERARLRTSGEFVLGSFSSSATGVLTFKNASNNNEINIFSPSTTSTYPLYLPASQGGVNTFIKNDGAGNLSFYDISNIAWSLTGNSGTIDGTNFIGTKDNVPFNIRVRNVKSGRIDSASANTFFGYSSGSSNTIGNTNSAFGAYSLHTNTSGNSNSALGFEALYSNLSGRFNVGIGIDALYSNSNGINNVAIGREALQSNVSGSSNVAIGGTSLQLNTGTGNTAVGAASLSNNTIGIDNVAVGTNCLNSVSTNNSNVAIGFDAFQTGNGDNNTAIGRDAFNSGNGSNNIALGFNSAHSVTGDGNTIIGNLSLFTSGSSFNSTLGNATAYNFSGGYGLFLGDSAGFYDNRIGDNNKSWGYVNTYDRHTIQGDSTQSLMYMVFGADSSKQKLTINGQVNITNQLVGTRITRRAPQVTQSATPAINTDITDLAIITGLAQAITSFTTNLTGTPITGDLLEIDITDDGTPRAITWGAAFVSSNNGTLPTTTTANKTSRVYLERTSGSTWICVDTATDL